MHLIQCLKYTGILKPNVRFVLKYIAFASKCLFIKEKMTYYLSAPNVLLWKNASITLRKTQIMQGLVSVYLQLHEPHSVL